MLNKNNIEIVLGIAAFSVAFFTSLCGLVLWYVEIEKKKYALERDLSHLKRTYDQLNSNLTIISESIDYKFDSFEEKLKFIELILIEIKSFISINTSQKK